MFISPWRLNFVLCRVIFVVFSIDLASGTFVTKIF